jgi:hypothetical protein
MTINNPLHFLHCFGSIHLRAEDGRTGNNDFSSGSEDFLLIIRTYAPIHFDPSPVLIRYDDILEPFDFFYH